MTDSLPPPPSAETFGAAAMERLAELARISEGGPGVTRRFLTLEHQTAANLLNHWMTQAGLSVTMDAASTLIGRYPGETADAPVLILGSHQDSVIQGGAFDGPLGIIVPLLAVDYLARHGHRLPFAIEVVAFGDEEGVRFGTTLFGSRALAGTLDLDELDQTDRNGVTVQDALSAFGLEPDEVSGLPRDPGRTLGFIEVHIEQGRILENAGLPVGVVTAIAGCARATVTIEGTAGHSGTVAMGDRHDALAGAAEIVLAVERLCSGQPGILGTVGQISAEPGAINVIPGRVTLSLDIRAPEPEGRDRTLAAVEAECLAIAGRRDLDVTVAPFYRADGYQSHPAITAPLARAVEGEGLPVTWMTSGAGHDAMAMGDLCPAGLIFVRCKDGISHTPGESILPEDAGAAVRVLLHALLDPELAERARAMTGDRPKG